MAYSQVDLANDVLKRIGSRRKEYNAAVDKLVRKETEPDMMITDPGKDFLAAMVGLVIAVALIAGIVLTIKTFFGAV